MEKQTKAWQQERLEHLDKDAETLFQIHREIEVLKIKVKALEREAAIYEKEFKEALANSDIGICDGYRIEYKRTTQKRFDQKAFQADHPKEFERYQKENIVRRFSIKPGEPAPKADDFNF